MLMRILFVLSLIAFIIWLYKQLKEGLRLLAITNAMSEARKTFVEWRYHNPGVYIGLSPKGRNLLIRYLHTYDAWLASHNLTDRNHYEKLVDLLNDFPPNEPNDMPPSIPKKPRDNLKGLLSFPLISLLHRVILRGQKRPVVASFVFPYRLFVSTIHLYSERNQVVV